MLFTVNGMSDHIDTSKSRAVLIGGAHWHLPLYQDALISEHEVVGVSDPDAAAAQTAAESLNTRPWTDWRQMLDELDGVDIAYVLGHHDAMAEVAHGLIARRIPFLLEKPGATNLADLRSVEEAALAAGVPAAAALVQRFGPLPELFGQLGDLDSFSFTFVAGPPTRYSSTGNAWVLDPEVSGGGCFALLGVHFADLFLLATGAQPDQLQARGAMSNARFALPVEDHALALYRTPNGTTATIEIGWTFPDSPLKRHVAYLLNGPEGIATIDSSGTVAISRAGQEVEQFVVNVDSDGLYPGFVQRLAASLDEGLAGMPTLTDLRCAMEAVQLAYADAAGVNPEDAQRWLC